MLRRLRCWLWGHSNVLWEVWRYDADGVCIVCSRCYKILQRLEVSGLPPISQHRVEPYGIANVYEERWPE